MTSPRARAVARSAARRKRASMRQRLPDAIAALYSLALRAWTVTLTKAALAHFSDPPAETLDAAREDAPSWLDWVQRKIGEFRAYVAQVFSTPPVRVIKKTATGVAEHTTSENRRILGIEPAGVSEDMLAAFRRANLDLITALPESFVDDLEAALTAAPAGLRVEQVAAAIKERGAVTASHADLIACDQVLKLNAQITRTQQQAAGVSEYEWSTSKDERVRHSHSMLQGTLHSWGSPPVVDPKRGRREHPGGDFRCRCCALPVLPNFLRDE